MGAGVVVLENVSCVIPAGGITSIIGPDGAGKSTLLSLISLLQQATRRDVSDIDIRIEDIDGNRIGVYFA